MASDAKCDPPRATAPRASSGSRRRTVVDVHPVEPETGAWAYPRTTLALALALAPASASAAASASAPGGGVERVDLVTLVAHQELAPGTTPAHTGRADLAPAPRHEAPVRPPRASPSAVGERGQGGRREALEGRRGAAASAILGRPTPSRPPVGNLAKVAEVVGADRRA